MMGRTTIGAGFALAGLLAAGQPAHATSRANEPPGVRIWTDHGEVYRHAERFQVFFRTERDAYVTVLRVDTDGRVHVLFPLNPGDPNLARGGETYTVPGVDDRDAFVVDDPPGVGYVYAVAADDPFDYDAFATDGRWNLQTTASLVDGRIHGDPAASLQEVAQNILPQGYADYDTHLLPYDVEQRYDYPRFLCYDCHAYTPYASWDPYSVWCPQFSLDVYYNPFYFYPSYWYPTRYYGGTNVVYVRPGIVGRQYVFRNRVDRAAPFNVYRDRRAGGLAPDRGVRGVDIGGVGSVPSPGGRRTVGGAFDPSGGGRRTVGGAIEPSGGGRRTVGGGTPAGSPQESGRRVAREAIPEPITNPRVIGPSRQSQEIAPMESRQRGVYIDPAQRPSTMPPAERAAPAESRRYIAPATGGAREAPRSSPGYAPRGGSPGYGAPRGGGAAPPAARAAPRAAPAPRSAPALVRRRG